MALILDTKRASTDRLEAMFFELLAMDRSDERFEALFEEVHRAIDIELALETEAESV